MNTAKSIPTSNHKTRELVINAIFIALTLVATMFINIRLPIMGNGGLIHLGNVPLFIAAFVFGKKTGAIAGGIGMGMFDLISGWTAWAPFTLVIVGCMGWVSGLVVERFNARNEVKYIIAIVLSTIIKITGYYFAEVILYGNWIVPFGSIPGNVIQVLVAGIIVLPFTGRLSKAATSMGLR